MRRRGRVRYLVLVVLVMCASAAHAQTVDDLLDPTTLQDVRLTVNARDLQALRADYLQNTYYPADIEWRNVHLRNVAIRSRGTGSRNPIKLGIKIEFDR